YGWLHPTPATQSYTRSLHDALPISVNSPEAWQAVQDARNASRPRSAWVAGTRARFVLPDAPGGDGEASGAAAGGDTSGTPAPGPDRKSTRLNSSHVKSSYAAFCLKK